MSIVLGPVVVIQLRRNRSDHRIEDPKVIEKILTHLDAKAAEPQVCSAEPDDPTRIPQGL